MKLRIFWVACLCRCWRSCWSAPATRPRSRATAQSREPLRTRLAAPFANAIVKVVSIDRGGETHNSTLTPSVPTAFPPFSREGTSHHRGRGFAPTVINDLDVRASLETNASAVLEITSASSTNYLSRLMLARNSKRNLAKSARILPLLRWRASLTFPAILLSLLLTEPGIQASSSRDAFTSNGIGFSANGARPRGNNFFSTARTTTTPRSPGKPYRPPTTKP